MLNFDVFLIEDFTCLILKALNTPGHVWVFFNDFLNDLGLSIMEVCERLFNVILFSLIGKWRKVGMTQELFKVAELILLDFACVNIILVLLSEQVFFVVSLKEWVDSLDFILLKHLW